MHYSPHELTSAPSPGDGSWTWCPVSGGQYLEDLPAPSSSGAGLSPPAADQWGTLASSSSWGTSGATSCWGSELSRRQCSDSAPPPWNEIIFLIYFTSKLWYFPICMDIIYLITFSLYFIFNDSHRSPSKSACCRVSWSWLGIGAIWGIIMPWGGNWTGP